MTGEDGTDIEGAEGNSVGESTLECTGAKEVVGATDGGTVAIEGAMEGARVG